MHLRLTDTKAIVTIEDSEILSGDKDAFLDLMLSKYDLPVHRSVTSMTTEYEIDFSIWHDKEFQKKFLILSLSL